MSGYKPALDYEDFGLGEYDGYHEEFDWDDLAEQVDTDYTLTLKMFDLAAKPTPSIMRPLMRWKLMGGMPDDVEIVDEIDTDDLWSNGLGGTPYGHLGTHITDKRMYLLVDGEKHHIKSYQIQMLPWPPTDKSRGVLTHILAYEPPTWGQWLPTLEDW